MNPNWKDAYPPIGIKVWPFIGYKSEMVHQAILRDDPDGFVGWMRESALDNTSKTFDGRTMQNYCEKYGAKKCAAALDQLEPISA